MGRKPRCGAGAPANSADVVLSATRLACIRSVTARAREGYDSRIPTFDPGQFSAGKASLLGCFVATIADSIH